jgi:hypothetical protein
MQQLCLAQERAFEAYGNRDFRTAIESLSGIIQQDPAEPRWLEMRAQVSAPTILLAACWLLAALCCQH